MYTIEEITDYANNRGPNAVHVGLEEYALYRRLDASHAPATATAGVSAATETDASAGSSAPSRAKMPGRKSMLFDPGSRVIIIRATTAKGFADLASGFGDAKYRERDNALRVNGVGAGSTPCARVGSFPIACS